jgi:hypothetical protein
MEVTLLPLAEVMVDPQIGNLRKEDMVVRCKEAMAVTQLP